MFGINKVVLVGHLGKNPEIRQLEGNIAVASFPLATTHYCQKEKMTEWHNIIMWRSLAEKAGKILQQGKLIYVEGKLRTRKFVDKDGYEKNTTEILAERFTVLGRSSDFDELH